ncbi:MAG: LPS assembly lipoprotein LptE [Gammaproteobacteria bacterium]
MRGVRVIVFAVVLSILGGCGGWHLRGVQNYGSATRHEFFVRSAGAYNVFVALQQEITNRGGALVSSPGTAQIIVDVERERFDRRILSVDPDTGKVREIELGLAVTFTARTSDGRLLIPREEATFEQDYVFDEGSVLGTVAVDEIVQRELAQLAATSIALRLQALRLPENSAGS